MTGNRLHLFDHYKKLFFFAFNRKKGNNKRLMSEYFARIVIKEIEEFIPLFEKKILDVGGAEGIFCKILHEQRKCDVINLDPNPKSLVWKKTRIGFAHELPFKKNEFDVVICRGVLEHIPFDQQQLSLAEICRVTKPGGICYVLIPPWYNPHAGHNLKPFHIFPFKTARFLRQIFFSNKIKESSWAETGMYPITFRKMKKMISVSNLKIIATRDTHLRMHFLTRIPVINEVLVPAVAFILQK